MNQALNNRKNNMSPNKMGRKEIIGNRFHRKQKTEQNKNNDLFLYKHLIKQNTIRMVKLKKKRGKGSF